MNINEQEIGATAKYLDTTFTIRQRMNIKTSTVKRLSGAVFIYCVIMGIFALIL